MFHQNHLKSKPCRYVHDDLREHVEQRHDVRLSSRTISSGHTIYRSGPPPSELPPELNLSPCNAKASLDAMGAEIFYEKTLTPSDANGSGRIVIPKAVAEMYFPFLENQAGIPLDAVDSMGNVYYFRFRSILFKILPFSNYVSNLGFGLIIKVGCIYWKEPLSSKGGTI